ncbi:PadR family transcriptional regulator [Acinetobacter kyonggiensis]|uniref:DNA-binding transcriptional regulator, PadR family n=1 Tax=Acinetobacter kyonggiensis TaxID=595670 RepID=A0A1H3GHC7_9GAMM|nr:PadR family transcriptional regulator [Acinetobacter kyonggiensis]SDY02691.1 DNA-binding transcriptional regulator, PadR family [Acinetobacter kyonggiensis]
MPKTPNPELLTDLESSQTLRKQRLFEAGQMKLLALHLISLAPKHGYDIIKDMGDIVGGGYIPSAGTIYPTLNYLEEHEFVASILVAGDRKQYSISPTGIEHLSAQQDQVESILGRFETRRKIHIQIEYIDIKRAMENLKASLRLKIQHTELTPEQVRCIADKIDQAAVEIGRL